MNDREALNHVLDLLNQELDTRQCERDEAVRLFNLEQEAHREH